MRPSFSRFHSSPPSLTEATRTLTLRVLGEDGVITEKDTPELTMQFTARGPDQPAESSPFCQINPKINEWTWKNATHFAMTFAFVVTSISQKWPDLIVAYPQFITFLLNNFTKRPLPMSVEEAYAVVTQDENFIWNEATHRKSKKFSYAVASKAPEFVPWLRLFLQGSMRYRAVATVWNDRQRYYAEAMKYKQQYDAIAADPHVARVSAQGGMHPKLAKFIGELQNYYTKLPGLQTAKAAFLVQLTIGRSGCLDSNNILVYADELRSNPEYAMLFNKPDPAKLRAAPNPLKTGEDPDRKRKVFFEAYNKFLDNVSMVSNESEFFWDNWVRLIAMKIQYSGQKAVGDTGKRNREIWVGVRTKEGAEYRYTMLPTTEAYQYVQNPQEQDPDAKAPKGMSPVMSLYLQASKIMSRDEVTPELVSNQHFPPLIMGAAQLGLDPKSAADVAKAAELVYGEARRPKVDPVTESLQRARSSR